MLGIMVFLSWSMPCYRIIIYRLQLPHRYAMLTKDVMLIFLPFYAWVSLIGYFLPFPSLNFICISHVTHTWYVCHTCQHLWSDRPKIFGEDNKLYSFLQPPTWIQIFLKLSHSLRTRRREDKKWMAGIAQSVQRLATGWTVWGLNAGGGEIFRTSPDRPWGPPSLL